MNTLARGTLPRAEKGPLAPPPRLDGALRSVADAVAAWPGVEATVHWHLWDRDRVDGVDFYLQEEELGHLHLDGAIHLATSPALGKTLVDEGAARPFRYQAGWVEEQLERLGADATIALFRRNYDAIEAHSRGR